MSKVGDVVYCVDCDRARDAHVKVAIEGSSGTLQEPPRRMATKKDASGDALCAVCLDARVQRRRAEFMQPRSASPPREPQPTIPSASHAVGLKLSPSYVRTIRSPAKRKSAPKRKAVRPKGTKNRSGGAVAAKAGGLKKAEAQLLNLMLEHGTTAVQRMLDRVSERIRKLM